MTTYIIGGVPRSGKTKVREELLNRYSISGISTDVLREGFVYGLPSFGIMSDDMEQTEAERSEILWPYWRGLLIARDYYSDKFIFEGTNFIPKYFAEFNTKENIKILFLGYPKIDPQLKLEQIRQFPSSEEWTDEMSDNELMDLIRRFIDISHELQDECLKYGIEFVDTSHNFTDKIEEAIHYLVTD